MKNFYTALMTYFNATTAGSHNTFWNDIGGRLYQGIAPARAEYPYCVFTHVISTQIDTFKNDIDNIVIQFSIFSDKSCADVLDNMTHLKSLFDDCSLTITGGMLVSFYHLIDGLTSEEVTTTTPGVQNIWHYHVDYNAVFERT